MNKTITTLVAVLTATACMAPMHDDMDQRADGPDNLGEEVGESGHSLTARRMGYKNGDPCTVTGEGTSHEGTRDGGFCCFENSRGNEECWNCYFFECKDSPGVIGGGGWEGGIIDRINP